MEIKIIDTSADEYNNSLGISLSAAQPDPDETAPEGYLYIVQVGAYKSLNNAKKLQRKLESMGVVSLIIKYRTKDQE